MMLQTRCHTQISFHYLQLKSTVMLHIVQQFNGKKDVHNDILNTKNTLQIIKETIFNRAKENKK